jgi:hypothetical protein
VERGPTTTGQAFGCRHRLKCKHGHRLLTLKGPKPFFGPFLKFGQAIVDAIFVQKISNFQVRAAQAANLFFII